jgi:hypothetical protein
MRLALAIALLGYVLPGEVVVEQMAAQRSRAEAVRFEATLDGLSEDWPERVTIELHPTRGYRVADDRGGRWLVAEGQVLAGSRMPAPTWIPPLDLLIMRDESRIDRFMRRLGVDLGANELARCGERDCFVLGGRSGAAQVRVDKDSFELLEIRLADGRRSEFGGYQVWGGAGGPRLPSEIQISDSFGRIGSLSLARASRASDLRAADFSPRWVEAAAAPLP